MPGLSGEGNLAQAPDRRATEETFARVVLRRGAKRLSEAPSGRGPLWRKAILIACWFAASYTALLASRGLGAYLTASVSMAFAAAALAFNVFHDASHGAFCRARRLNVWIARLCCAALGIGRHFWLHKHHTLHHSYPNVFEWDDDLDSRGFLRLSPAQEWRPLHRGQHFYFLPLYAINSVEWIFIKDFVQYFGLRTDPHQHVPPLAAREKLEFWFCKAVYGVVFVVAPLCFQPVLAVAFGFLAFHVVMGLLLAFVTQFAHINDAVAFPALSIPPRADDWAAHQVRTTANFATRNPVVNWFTGGLNFQIEHHLFPRVAHTRYPEIGGLVREATQQFGLPYIEHPTLRRAIAAHVRLLYRLSLPEEAPVRRASANFAAGETALRS